MSIRLVGISIASLFSMTVIAGSMGVMGDDDAIPGACGKVVTLSVGPAWYNNKADIQRNFFPSLIAPPGILHTYVPKDNSGILGTGELFFGLTRAFDTHYSAQAGIAVAYSGDGKDRGVLILGPSLSPDRFPYSYKLSNGRISLKGKLASDWGFWAQPYISGSGGVGFNRSWAYTTTHAIDGIVSRPSFGSDTTVAFTYTAGAGLQGNITPNWQIGVGYEFADWGKNSLGDHEFHLLRNSLAGVGRFPYRAPHSGNFYTHELQFSLSYLM